jgi:hypothetical protein
LGTGRADLEIFDILNSFHHRIRGQIVQTWGFSILNGFHHRIGEQIVQTWRVPIFQMLFTTGFQINLPIVQTWEISDY